MDVQNDNMYLSDELVEKYCLNDQLISFVQSQFNRLSRESAKQLIRLLLLNYVDIKAKDFVKKTKSFLLHNLGKFSSNDDENNAQLKLGDIKELKRILIEKIDYIMEEPKIMDKKTNLGTKDISVRTLTKDMDYEKIRHLIEEEVGNIEFNYDFEACDMEQHHPKNTNTLQRCKIQILSQSVNFEDNLVNKYVCPECGKEVERLVSDTESTNGRIICRGFQTVVEPNGESKQKKCGRILQPNSRGQHKNAYYYIIAFDEKIQNNTKRIIGSAMCYEILETGFYDTVLFTLKNPHGNKFVHIMDIKKIEPAKIKLPIQTPSKNYLYVLQETFDVFILQQTRQELWGMFPVKLALIIQKAFSIFDFRLNGNIQLIGEKSTFKSTTLKYYGYLLNGWLHLETTGLSISVPSLRGTRVQISLFDKEYSTLSIGHLGLFKSIHMDEAGQDKAVVDNLKAFLAEENYSYDKVGGMNTPNKRTAHVNLSENESSAHLEKYINIIRKQYRELNVRIGKEEKIDWRDDWDLHLPLSRYDNPYLKNIIKNTRRQFNAKQIFWIGGYDLALHDRFPFYFYLEKKKTNEIMDKSVARSSMNTPINDNLELAKVLKTDDIDIFFRDVIKFKDSLEEDIKMTEEVRNIIKQYDYDADDRIKVVFYNIVKVSRIVNQRFHYEKMDFDILRFFLERIDRKIDIADMDNYNIHGPPDLQKQKEIDKTIEESTKNMSDLFGLPEDEFK